MLAIDGRLRDRAEFVKRHALASDASDAALILAAYAARGPALFESLTIGAHDEAFEKRFAAVGFEVTTYAKTPGGAGWKHAVYVGVRTAR